MSYRHKRTFVIDGQEIKIISRPRFYCAEPCGWIVQVNGLTYQLDTPTREEAEDKAYKRWASENLASNAEVPTVLQRIEKRTAIYTAVLGCGHLVSLTKAQFKKDKYVKCYKCEERKEQK